MSDSWKSTSIAQCLAESFAGEWGADPVPGNAVVYRATDIDDEGRIVGGGAARRLPMGKLASKALQTGDILLEGSGGGPGKPVGRVAYFDSKTHGGPATCSNFFRTLRPARDHVDPRFLLQKLFWFYRQPPILALQQQTTGIINLKFEGYLASRIEVPELISEQAKIAEILDTHDTAIHVDRRWAWAGEVLARGQVTSDRAVEGWLNSPSHRAILLSRKAKRLGAYHHRPTRTWVVHLGRLGP